MIDEREIFLRELAAETLALWFVHTYVLEG
jgi:hypothetical protein